MTNFILIRLLENVMKVSAKSYWKNEVHCGSGTTMKVAAELNRKAIGYEISDEYCRLIVKRNKQQVLL